MAFPSKYNFTCSKCGIKGNRGEQITWSRKERGKVYHATCQASPLPMPVPAKLPYSCFLCPNIPGFGSQIEYQTHFDMTHKEEQSNAKVYTVFVGFCDVCTSAIYSSMPSVFSDGVNYHQKCFEKKGNKTMLVKETTPNSNPLDVFINAIVPQLEGKLKSKLDENAVNDLINKAIKETSKPIAIEVTNRDTGDITRIERPHKDLKSLLYFISKKQHVYLYGPAGSGKSTAAQHCAEALKIEFGYISLNPQTPDSRILGFIDAGGTYRETPFYRCYKNGGIFCIDEMDNASAALLTTLNSMLENGHGAFPNGLVTRHQNFVLVATGNTNGRGGNPMFPERRPFDAAFAERFTFMFWDYDRSLERAVTLSVNPKAEVWLQWVSKVRDYCGKHFPRVLVSPRASFKGAEYLKDSGMTVAEIAEAVVFKGLDKDTVNKIASAVPYPTKEASKEMAI